MYSSFDFAFWRLYLAVGISGFLKVLARISDFKTTGKPTYSEIRCLWSRAFVKNTGCLQGPKRWKTNWVLQSLNSVHTFRNTHVAQRDHFYYLLVLHHRTWATKLTFCTISQGWRLQKGTASACADTFHPPASSPWKVWDCTWASCFLPKQQFEGRIEWRFKTHWWNGIHHHLALLQWTRLVDLKVGPSTKQAFE